MTFAAACTGAGENDVIRYTWDFDGDGTVDLVTMSATATWTYTTPGTVSVSLSAVDETTGQRGECVREDYLRLVPATMYVVTTNSTSAFPYDTWQNAATNVQDAIDAAIDGVDIVFSNGNYTVSGTISVEKGVTLRSLTGAPGDVVLSNPGAVRILRLNHAGALVAGLVFSGKADKGVGSYICIDSVGGTMSNCVIRGVVSDGNVGAYANTATIYAVGANALMTHCVITGNVFRIGSSSAYSKEVVPTVWLDGGARLSTSLVADNTDTGTRNITGYATVYAGDSKVVNPAISDTRGGRTESGGGEKHFPRVRGELRAFGLGLGGQILVDLALEVSRLGLVRVDVDRAEEYSPALVAAGPLDERPERPRDEIAVDHPDDGVGVVEPQGLEVEGRALREEVEELEVGVALVREVAEEGVVEDDRAVLELLEGEVGGGLGEEILALGKAEAVREGADKSEAGRLDQD